MSSLPFDQDLFDSSPSSQPQPQPAPPNTEAQAADPPLPEPESAEDETLLPPPDFRPFFTLIADPHTGEYHHPTVHYLFSDDDPEILTGAALEAIDAGDTHARNTGAEEDETAEDGGVEERVVIVDLAADGKTVTGAVSLSKEWQALRTEVGAAPSMGGGGVGGGAEGKAGDEESGRGLMLKISGVEARREGDNAQGKGSSLEALVGRFGEVLGELDEVVGKEEKGW